MSLIHLELLDKERQAVFEKLGVFRDQATLAGGTALIQKFLKEQAREFRKLGILPS